MSYFHLPELRVAAVGTPWRSREIDRHLDEYIAARLALPPAALKGYRILNKSVDSRRGHPELVYALAVELDASELEPWEAPPQPELELPPGPFARHPIVVGAGPAGLFAALLLARAGAEPLILERGFEVERRRRDIRLFQETRELNPESNYLFGEGGAGTFSDGKLYTRIRDPLAAFVVDRLIAAGAPEEIAYLKRPHLGSDRLPGIIRKLRSEIIAHGGTFRFGCRVQAPAIAGGRCAGVTLASGEELDAPAVLLAHGLGGRELTLEALEAGVGYQLKPFQIGCRIEHPQQLVDSRQYRRPRRPSSLGAAEYHFAADGVSTFCMCPGGEVVMAAGAPGRLSTNGMSRYRRDGDFANAALIVTCDAGGFASPREVYDMLDKLERKAFRAGGGDYTFPAQDAAAFLDSRVVLRRKADSTAFGLTPADLAQFLPKPAVEGLRRALPRFDRLMPGYIRQGVLIGLESHVSSPVRFIRSAEDGAMSSCEGLFFAGEGAGYAGGIISAAVDGLKVARKLLDRIGRQ